MFTSKDDFDQAVEFIKQIPAFATEFKYPNLLRNQNRHLRYVYMIHGEGKLKALKELSVYPARSEEYYLNIAYQAIENDMSDFLAGAMFLVSPGAIRRCIQILKNQPEIKALYHPEPFPPHINFPIMVKCLPYVYYNKVGTDLTPTVHNELLYDTDTYNSLINKTVKAVPKEILIADQHFSQYRSLSSEMRQNAIQAARVQGNESLVVPFALALSKGIALADLDASTILEELNCSYLTNMNDNGSEQIEQNSTKLDSSNATVTPQSQSSNAAPSGNKLESSTHSKAAIASKASTAISKATPTAKDLTVASEHDKDDANNATKQATTASSSVATESNKSQQDSLSSSKINSKDSSGSNKASDSGSNNGSNLTCSDSGNSASNAVAKTNGNTLSSTSQEAQGNSSATKEQSSTKTTASNSTTASVSHDVSASEATADTADKLEGDSANTVDNSSGKDNHCASTNDKQKNSNENKAVNSTNGGNDSNTSNSSEAKPVAVIFQTYPGIDPVEKQAESSTNTANETIDASTNDDDLAIEQELAAQEELEALYQSDYDDIYSDIDTDNEDSAFDEMLLEDIPTNVEFTNGKPCTPINEATTNQESDASNEDSGSCDSSDSVPSDATNKSAANSNESDGETAENNSDSPEAENIKPEIDDSTLDPIARANMRASKLLAQGNMNDIDQSRKHGFDSNKLHVFGIGSQELNELLANTLQNRRKGVTPNDLQALPKRFVILGGAKNNVLRAKNLSNYHVLAIFGKQDTEYCNFCDQQDTKTKAQITKQNSQLRATLLELLTINSQAPN